jgi:hypothetical protein
MVRLQILGSSQVVSSLKVDYQPPMDIRDFYVFPYDMRHCVYPFNGTQETRRTLAANCDVLYNPIHQQRCLMILYEPKWKSLIVETTTPIFTPEQCQLIINAGRSEPQQTGTSWRNCRRSRLIRKLELHTLAGYLLQRCKRCIKYIREYYVKDK